MHGCVCVCRSVVTFTVLDALTLWWQTRDLTPAIRSWAFFSHPILSPLKLVWSAHLEAWISFITRSQNEVRRVGVASRRVSNAIIVIPVIFVDRPVVLSGFLESEEMAQIPSSSFVVTLFSSAINALHSSSSSPISGTSRLGRSNYFQPGKRKK